MKIQQFQPDQEGYMIINNIIRPLNFGIQNHKPTFWAVVDPLSKKGQYAKIVVKRNDAQVGPELLPHYRTTVVDNDSGEVYHLFEEPSKLINPPILK